MIIKSNTKDYYDHQAYVWGGGDPSIQYIRKPLSPLTRGKYSSDLRRDSITIYGSGVNRLIRNDEYDVKYLAVVGKYYILFRKHRHILDPTPNAPYKLLTEFSNPDLYAWYNKNRENRHGIKFVKSGEFSEELVVISRKLDAPVFSFETCGGYSEGINIDPEVPHLGELGMASIIGPEQMYQDISYFLGNIMKESPDMMPPTKMSDKEKIVGHGFDLKQSFRHRV
jgi:hypothetical protein